MKASILTLAVTAALASVAAANAATVFNKDGSSLDVYGRVQSVLYSTEYAETGDYNDASIDSSARLGLNMRSELTSWVSAFAKAEWEAANGESGEGDADDFDTRYLFVGADFGVFGQVKAGKFEDAVKYVIEQTDIFDDWGCNGQLGNDDRRSSQLMYSWSGYGLDANVSYGSAANSQHVDGAFYSSYGDNGDKETVDIKNAFAVSVGYTSPDVLFGPISIRTGYGYALFQNDRDNASLDNSVAMGDNGHYESLYHSYNQWAVSASWGHLNSGLYLAATYQARTFDLNRNYGFNGQNGTHFSYGQYTVQGAEGVAGYTFANGISIRGGIEWMQISTDDGDEIDVDSFTAPLYVNYQLNPNFNIWVEGRVNIDTYDEKNYSFKKLNNGVYNYAQDVISVGARYTF